MSFWIRSPPDRESQSERLRKFRNMHAAHYGTRPEERETSRPAVPQVAFQVLCPTCSRPMDGEDPETSVCRARTVSPFLHEQLDHMVRTWRAGAVDGKVLPAYMRTLGLVRLALANAVERSGDLGGRGRQAP
ncbi:MAG: hypothetical protein KGJ23_03695 [Euryarchaeota archaeon]|nr:hypothetical protein [Euryarchaeota archaeon]MDE1835704.1 hypothetical protein [Euryarchaeota archaeon]MDE1880434.1 hypothetical protein [Euryarchaeota archaeon]MDE2043894.1 hypothetical protein [Thermoplasmata archaeon]